ncbi:hypothetical protein [Photobacterium damselae]|uniref:hypothetical protein n=1 Tax=Photobacterium damselae TaxID=38293 RepID=UPI000D16FD61|nr:hypothetical protein [Photobacterium damselae]PSV59582.1 hypothetical protein CTT35_15305 [Photobacterium damselae]PSW76276.1 hypothetical protein CTT37_15250 [Photobacterium damselae]
MNEEELKTLLSPFIRDINGGVLSNLACIKTHAELLLSLRAKGVPLRLIVELSGTSYSNKTFSKKLSGFKKSLAIKPKEMPTAEKGTFSKAALSSSKPETKQEPIKPDNKEESDELEYSLDDWISNTRLSKGNIRLYRQGEKDGLTPDDFKGFKNYNNIAMIRLFQDWSKIVETPVYEWDEPKVTKEEFLSKYKI